MFHVNFIKFMPNEYVLRYKKGAIVQEGVGIYDFQTVTVQGQLTHRIADYKKIIQTLNYTFDMKAKKYVIDNSQNIAQRLINISKVLTKKHIEHTPMKEEMRQLSRNVK